MTDTATPVRARRPRARKPALATKLRPRQARAQDTFELILETAGQLLERIGFEQLTTNLICEAAGLSPPALYRYFPNKYAVLKELGDRLMRAQDDEVIAWADAGGLTGATVEERVARTLAIHERVAEIQRNFPGGLAIGRALRAVPVLQDIRFRSRDLVAAHFFRHMRKLYPATDPRRLEVVTRMTVELSYAAMEMVVEEPDRDADIINREVCLLFAHYFASFS
ncbi:MAG: TetR/AcrR family transcriptional regulator [Proteobacteria bacterium]|nr:TetR/AcrR family transcriptional regulator [Pseudomonadota bacterium]